MSPAVSKNQRKMMAIAEHNPEMLYARNKGVLNMSKEEMHKYATTEEKGLPLQKRLSKRKVKR